MRIRSLWPGFWRDEITGMMAPSLALFYLGMSGYADDEGRFEWNTALIHADLDPYGAKWGDLAGIDKQLSALQSIGRIFPYRADGRQYGWLPTQKRHQKPNHPSNSKLPPPPGELREHYRSRAGALTPVVVVVGVEVGVEKPCAEPEKPARAPASPDGLPASPDGSPVVAVLPCVGKGGRAYPVTAAKIAEWQESYPAVDVLREVKALVQWARDNPAKRKTYRGAAAFFSRNLAKKQDQNPSRKPVPNGRPEDAPLLRALADAERGHPELDFDADDAEPSAGDCGDGPGVRGSPPLYSPADCVPAHAAPLSATVGALLGHRR